MNVLNDNPVIAEVKPMAGLRDKVRERIMQRFVENGLNLDSLDDDDRAEFEKYFTALVERVTASIDAAQRLEEETSDPGMFQRLANAIAL